MASKFRGLLNKKGKKRNELPIEEPVAFEQHEVEELLETLKEPVVEVKNEQLAQELPKETAAPAVSEGAKTFAGYGIVYNNAKKKFQLISLDFSLETGYSSITSVKDFADDPATALHKLNKLISLKLLKREENY